MIGVPCRRCCENEECEKCVPTVPRILIVQVESVATTLALAEQNHAEELKRVCLEYVSKHLSLVIASEGYQHMVNSCPQLQVQPLAQACVSSAGMQLHSSCSTMQEVVAQVAVYQGGLWGGLQVDRVLWVLWLLCQPCPARCSCTHMLCAVRLTVSMQCAMFHAACGPMYHTLLTALPYEPQ